MTEKPLESAPPDDFSFERAIRELEVIVERMERGDQPLEQAMRDFEDGMALSEQCKKSLDAAQLRMEKLIVRNDRESLEPMETGSDLKPDDNNEPF